LKPETLQRLRLSTKSLMRAVVATPWFWKGMPLAARRNRRLLQDQALQVIEEDNFMADVSLPERAAHALSEMFEAVKVTKHGAQLAQVNEHTFLRFFESLAAKPAGRPRLQKYHHAAAIMRNGKAFAHRLCLQFEPGYRDMDRAEQKRARDRMRSGVFRILSARTKTPS
jgi:hypothetical protein